MAQSRHQPGVLPINPSVRAQVPHQFLSPQVQNVGENSVFFVNLVLIEYLIKSSVYLLKIKSYKCVILIIGPILFLCCSRCQALC